MKIYDTKYVVYRLGLYRNPLYAYSSDGKITVGNIEKARKFDELPEWAKKEDGWSYTKVLKMPNRRKK